MKEIVGDGCVTSYCDFLYVVIIGKFGDKIGHGNGYHWQIWY